MPTSRPPPCHQPTPELGGGVGAQRLHLLRRGLLVRQEALAHAHRAERAASRRRPAGGPRSAASGCCRRRCRCRSRPRSSSSWRSRASRSGPPPRPRSRARRGRWCARSRRAARSPFAASRMALVASASTWSTPVARQNAAYTAAVCRRELHPVGPQHASPSRLAHAGADPDRLADLVDEAPPRRIGLVAEDHEPPRVRAHVDDRDPLHRPDHARNAVQFPGSACRWWDLMNAFAQLSAAPLRAPSWTTAACLRHSSTSRRRRRRRVILCRRRLAHG